jgi:hypothetical protein
MNVVAKLIVQLLNLLDSTSIMDVTNDHHRGVQNKKLHFTDVDMQQLNNESYLSKCEEKLYIPRDTYKCYKQGCICCAYKIIVHRPKIICNGNKCPPNKRPEMCLRIQGTYHNNSNSYRKIAASFPFSSSKACNSYGIYKNQPGVRILTIGDGDLSFTFKLAQNLPKCRVVGTTYLSKSEFKSVYSDAETMLDAISMLSNIRIIHGVDATMLGKKKSPLAHSSEASYHKIVWNFPCIAPQNNNATINSLESKRDGQNAEMEKNKALLMKFFSRCHHVGVPGGEIHILHKTKASYSHWGIIELATAAGLLFRSCVIFDKALYPGYRNRKARSGKGSFPCHDARIFIFTLPLVRTLSSPQRPLTNFLTPLDDISEFKACSSGTLKSVVKRLFKSVNLNPPYYKKNDPVISHTNRRSDINDNSSISDNTAKILGKRKKKNNNTRYGDDNNNNMNSGLINTSDDNNSSGDTLIIAKKKKKKKQKVKKKKKKKKSS